MSAFRGQVGPAYEGLRQAAAAAPGEQAYAESAMDLRIASHPLMIPVRPIMRFGPLKTWVAALVRDLGPACRRPDRRWPAWPRVPVAAPVCLLLGGPAARPAMGPAELARMTSMIDISFSD